MFQVKENELEHESLEPNLCVLLENCVHQVKENRREHESLEPKCFIRPGCELKCMS